jgi:hypothetical protein
MDYRIYNKALEIIQSTIKAYSEKLSDLDLLLQLIKKHCSNNDLEYDE